MFDRIARDPNIIEAKRLLARALYLQELERLGKPMTRQKARRFLGVYPECVMERIEDLTAHIGLTDPDGNVIVPAAIRH